MRKRPTHRECEADGHANNDHDNDECGDTPTGNIAQSLDWPVGLHWPGPVMPRKALAVAVALTVNE